MSEYNIFLIESTTKGKDSKFGPVSQDLIISGIDQDLKADNFIGKIFKEDFKYKVIFKESNYLYLLEKLSKTLKINDFNISVDPEIIPTFEQIKTTITEQVVVDLPLEEPIKEAPKIFRRSLEVAFRCPHLGDPESKNNALANVINPDKIRDITEKDAYNCLVAHQGYECPLATLCYSQNLLSGVTRAASEVKDQYDLFVFDFTNHDQDLSLIIQKNGTMALAPNKKN